MARVVFNGEPGEVWENQTGRAQYQFICELVNTCGLCLQYHMAVAAYWSIPLHRNCRCRVLLILPGARAEPFVDFRDVIATLPDHMQVKVVGAGALKLIDRGVVAWSDVVTSNRVRTLREVVSRQQLTIDQMVRAGVRPADAKHAFEAVATPAHVLADQQRREAVRKLTGAGLKPTEVREALAKGLASRATIGAGPSGPQASPVKPWTPPPGLLGGAAALALKPKPKPTDHQSLGVEFVPSQAAQDSGAKTVVVSVDQLDAAWRQDGGYYLPPGGGGPSGKPGAYANALDFLRKAQAQGLPFEQSRIAVDGDGVVSFLDGRHRFAVLRDLGIETLPVSVDADQAATIRKQFGVATPKLSPAIVQRLGLKPTPPEK